MVRTGEVAMPDEALDDHRGGPREGSGRPRLPGHLKKSVRVWASMTPAQKEGCKKKAKAAGLKLQDWARAKLLS
jgi:hypothetical protein